MDARGHKKKAEFYLDQVPLYRNLPEATGLASVLIEMSRAHTELAKLDLMVAEANREGWTD